MRRKHLLAQLDATIAENSQVIAENHRVITENSQVIAENHRVIAENSQVIAENHRVTERAIQSMDGLREFNRELLLRFDKRMERYDASHKEILAALVDLRSESKAILGALLALIDRIERLEPGGGAA